MHLNEHFMKVFNVTTQKELVAEGSEPHYQHLGAKNSNRVKIMLRVAIFENKMRQKHVAYIIYDLRMPRKKRTHLWAKCLFFTQITSTHLNDVGYSTNILKYLFFLEKNTQKPSDNQQS